MHLQPLPFKPWHVLAFSIGVSTWFPGLYPYLCIYLLHYTPPPRVPKDDFPLNPWSFFWHFHYQVQTLYLIELIRFIFSNLLFYLPCMFRTFPLPFFTVIWFNRCQSKYLVINVQLHVLKMPQKKYKSSFSSNQFN